MAFTHTKRSGSLYVKGHCKDCDQTWEGGGTQLHATNHFHSTGHTIHVEQAIWWEWQPKLDGSGQPIPKKATKKKRRKARR